MNIELTVGNYRCFVEDRPLKFTLQPGVTSLIGPNNSGKSAVFRLLHDLRPLFRDIQIPGIDLTHAMTGAPRRFSVAETVLDRTELFSNSNDRDLWFKVRVREYEPRSNSHIEPPSSVTIRVRRSQPDLFVVECVEIENGMEAHDLTWQGAVLMKSQGGALLNFEPYQAAFKILERCFYIGAFRNVLNLTAERDHYDTKVGRQLIEQWNKLRTGNSKKENELALRVTESIGRILEMDDLRIEELPDKTDLKVFIGRKPYAAGEIGSGLSQLFVILANAALNQPSYLLIDEPEMNLHFSLQGSLVGSLVELAEYGVVFSTHSVSLARSRSDRSYLVRPIGQGQSEMREMNVTKDVGLIIKELGYYGDHEIGFDAILLVEGETDQDAYRSLLSLYEKHSRVLLWPLFGKTNINKDTPGRLHELRGMGVVKKIAAVIDSEREEAGGPIHSYREDFKKACDDNGIECLILERRALENYFNDDAVKRALGTSKDALGPFQRFDESIHWPKKDNWKIARASETIDLRDTDLGKFLEAL